MKQELESLFSDDEDSSSFRKRKKYSALELMQDYYGKEYMRSVIRINLSNKHCLEYLHEFMDLK
eukprot:CAMPEP_0168325730 /NCGR_PEP_ID=MMETSP0213-20121227/4863_1 /TAXON_ID=151035 /ORGANISM="Euplotes harpa, Strain FSP1.4" /LENGTH=63 /DNA_ID=CAMNT_0008328273 /DNA_START=20 /DNA_END=211 /DNA_ORIENTATION=-